MINLYDKFNLLNRSIKDSQYPIATNGAIKAYYGISRMGFIESHFCLLPLLALKVLPKQ